MIPGLPWWLSGKKSTCQCRRHGFDPWVGKTPTKKEMAIHSSILVWEIPWTEEPGGLQSTGSQRVGHNSATKQQSRTVFRIQQTLQKYNILND